MDKITKNIFLSKINIIVVFIALILVGFFIGRKYPQSIFLIKDARTAEQIALKAFEEKWEQVSDGCDTYCEGCGVKSSRKIETGYIVAIEYACGMKPDHRLIELTVFSNGKIEGLEEPTPVPGSNQIYIQQTEQISPP
ncbi:hypothetical protein A2954_00915 [Candidatus Roizmanbacteria bacterium RIFCSPLOWO2_01_FULL_37_12]|uniref:Uncharacterized protein n=1 Tax=Candidatus Roizmanbacteria bacterium RIFCSPLOWO2_01_FULL_37_12 TaxID=1802056 RepID=A0A1F7IGA8_9BACT|nr:MAG: hypothetical protein A3D76_06915 [Candidatus Roizmanbacteria bacterium RIFCSPHIGHO2_02_FULL_37_9b]OGK42389.1 MAG: hypothetical protein A2954_00915 [Candidatus Roizmanbacteria bacterium RIFCSPLOWO2_01_FULL_37_12]